MCKLILGVDGGATKSHLAVFDDSGKCVGATAYGPLNHESMAGSYAELEERLYGIIPHTLKNAGVSAKDVAYAVFGLSGVDTTAQVQLISNMVRKTGIKDFVVCNDSILGVPAGCPDCVGICAINGTGFKLASIDHSGAIFETCGLGSYTDDKGGGSWYTPRICSAVYNALYKLGNPTIMCDMLFELIGISKKEELLEAMTEMFYAGSMPYDGIGLNNIVFKAAAQNDAVALSVLEESATQYAGGIAWLAMEMVFPRSMPLNVTLAGSIFVKQKVKILHEMIEKRVADILGSRLVVYNCLDTPPVAGAVIWAAQKAGFMIELEAVKAALKQNL